MFTYALGGVDLEVMLSSSNPEAAIILSLIYQFGMGTILMSLLTGWAGLGGACRGHASARAAAHRVHERGPGPDSCGHAPHAALQV